MCDYRLPKRYLGIVSARALHAACAVRRACFGSTSCPPIPHVIDVTSCTYVYICMCVAKRINGAIGRYLFARRKRGLATYSGTFYVGKRKSLRNNQHDRNRWFVYLDKYPIELKFLRAYNRHMMTAAKFFASDTCEIRMYLRRIKRDRWKLRYYVTTL